MKSTSLALVTWGLFQVAWLAAPSDAWPQIDSLGRTDSLTTFLDIEDALVELQEAGVLPAAEELHRLLAGPLEAAPDKGTMKADRLISGTVRVRGEPAGTDGLDPRVTFRSGTENVSMRGAFCRRSDGEREVRGSLNLNFSPIDFRVGDLGYAWGYGLLSSSPGRGPSLAAGSRLLSARNGPTSGGSQFASFAVSGVSLLTGTGHWQVGMLAGSPQGNRTSEKEIRSLVTVSNRAASHEVGVLLSRYGEEEGVSSTGKWRNRWLAGGWESATWRGAAVGGTGHSWAGHVEWTGSKALLAEGFLCGNSGGEAPRAGRRPAALPTADAKGWGVRAGFKPRPAIAVRMMWARGRGIEGIGAVARRERSLTDLEIRWRVDRSLWFSGRWRRKIEGKTVWSERFPWEVATPEPESRRMVFSLAAGGQSGSRSYQLLLRSQADAAEPSPRTRTLLQASGKWQIATGTGCRFAWANAWGGDADLVSAVSPLSGFVLPRHWGRWQSELLAGIERLWMRWRFQIAVSRRIPTTDQESDQTWSIWAQTSLSW
jgi:hypothetical protein